MKKVYLIRHGLPDFPGGKRMCLGTTDIPLGEAGLLQAETMAKMLPRVTAVFSSPLTRAVQTAQAIGMPITFLEDLRELHAGAWDGLTFDEIKARYPALYEARGRDKSQPLPGAEDHDSGAERFAAAVEEAARIAPGDFAVVAHGGVISHFLKKFAGVFHKPDYVEVITLTYDSGTFHLEEENRK